jgi:hypothetical protein
MGTLYIPFAMLILATIVVLCKCNKKAFMATVTVIGIVWLVGLSAYVYASGSARRLLNRAASRTTKIVIEVQGRVDNTLGVVETVEITSESEIAAFFDALKLKLNSVFMVKSCACRGNPQIHLHDTNGPFVKITIHHGKSIRCSLWSGNVDIQNDMIPKLKHYFKSRGVELAE